MPQWEGWRPTRNRPTGNANSVQARLIWKSLISWPSTPVLDGSPAKSAVEDWLMLSPHTTLSMASAIMKNLARPSKSREGCRRSWWVRYWELPAG